jgi:molybdenum cofactor biosynthesis protein B
MMTLPPGTQEHRAEGDARPPVRCALLTVSDSRTVETDAAGALMRQLVEGAGHTVADYALLKNDEAKVRDQVRAWLTQGDVDAVLITGGTGLGSKDRTIEAVRPLLEKELPGFGEIFRVLSFQEQVGTAAILSRALAGSAKGTFIVSLPGSKAAVELALTRIVLPELRHLVRELRR